MTDDDDKMIGREEDYEPSGPSRYIETGFARGRIPGRVYTSRTFANGNYNSADYGQPSRFIYQVFDDDGTASSLSREGEEYIVTPIEGSRFQVKVLVSREAGAIVDLWIQRVPSGDSPQPIKDVLRVRREDARRLAEFFRAALLLEPDGVDVGVRVDEETLKLILNQPDTAARLYEEQGPLLRSLIARDEDARDVVALAGRRAALQEFRMMLEDSAHFDSLVLPGSGPEAVWQRFFESNPWILGVGLGTQLFSSWSDEKLEQVVAGASIAGVGKRADALLRTSGLIKSMVFAEIKHHSTPLLGAKYRSGTWPMSSELAGGIAQVQMTVHEAVSAIGSRIVSKDENGFDALDSTYLLRPRSFLVIGQLSQFVDNSGNHHREKVTSFELARRHLQEPEVVTFDELLARAEWIVEQGG